VDDNGNLSYVSGDAYVMKIQMDMDDFRQTYKATYNIPPEQAPCGKEGK
jgi:hypothetical protein